MENKMIREAARFLAAVMAIIILAIIFIISAKCGNIRWAYLSLFIIGTIILCLKDREEKYNR